MLLIIMAIAFAAGVIVTYHYMTLPPKPQQPFLKEPPYRKWIESAEVDLARNYRECPECGGNKLPTAELCENCSSCCMGLDEDRACTGPLGSCSDCGKCEEHPAFQ